MYFFALIVKHLGVNVMFNNKTKLYKKNKMRRIYQASYNATHLETTYISGVI